MAVGTNPGLSGTQLSRVPVSSGSYLPTRTARDSSVNLRHFQRRTRGHFDTRLCRGALRANCRSEGEVLPTAQTQLCVEITHPNHNDGPAIQLATCNGTNAQQRDPPGGLAPNARPAAPGQPKWVIATSDVLAPSDTLLAANNELRLQQQGAGSGDDGNLLIVETNCAARRA